MTIAAVEYEHFALPFSEKVILKDRPHPGRQGYYVRLVSESGSVAIGEAAPLPGFSRESLEEVRVGLVDLGEQLGGVSISDSGEIREALGSTTPGLRLPSLRFAVEMAILKLLAVERGMLWPTFLANQLGRELKDRPIDVAGLVTDRQTGFRASTIKIKVGSNTLAEDIDRVRRLFKENPDARLRIDVNRRWSLPEATRAAQEFEGLPIEFFEEPVDPRDLENLMRDFSFDIALDESLGEIQLERIPGAAFVVIKPTILGGLSRCLAVAEAAERMGANIIVSSAFESPVGWLDVMGLSWVLGSRKHAAGTGTINFFKENQRANLGHLKSYGALPWGEQMTGMPKP